jgi:filamentous hemagglutinin family protein
MRNTTLQIAFLALAAAAGAQSLDPTPGTTPPIELDGSIGPGGDVPFADGTWQIGDQLGEYRGDSLLHSFGRFDVPGGQTAEFSAAHGTPERVLARVTWGERSDIEGTLRSSIPGADLYLINPTGVRIAGGAQLDVQGSFVATSAGRVNFGAGQSFSVDPTKPLPLLTIEEPSSFGFLPQGGSAIEIDQIDGALSVQPGRTLALIGGSVDLFGGNRIIATSPGSRIALVAAGPGVEVDADLSAFDPGSIPSSVDLGSVRIRSAVIGASNPGGSVLIRAGNVRLEDSSISANHNGIAPVGFEEAVDIAARDQLALTRSNINVLSGGTTSTGANPGGEIHLSGESILLGDSSEVLTLSSGDIAGPDLTVTGGSLDLSNGSRLRSDSRGRQPGGDLRIGSLDAPLTRVSMTSGGRILSEARNAGHGGAVEVHAQEIDASDAGFSTTGTAIASTTIGSLGAAAGNISIDADTISLHDGAQIFSSTSGSGNTGSVHVDANSIELTGIEFDPADPAAMRNRASLIETRVLEDATGNGGELQLDGSLLGVSVDTGTLHVEDGAEVGTTTLGFGDAGNVAIAAEFVSLEGGFSGPGVLTSDALNEGPEGGSGGNLFVDTSALSLHDGGQITTSTRGTGNAGSIAIHADHVEISGQAGGNQSAVFAQTLAAQFPDGGDAGNVLIVSKGDVALRGGGSVAVKTTNGGSAGTATILADGSVLLDDGAITASTNWTGDAGDVVIAARELEIRGEQAGIFAQTLKPGLADAGNAGDVHIDTTGDVFLHDTGGDTGAGGIFVETRNNGAAGTVDIDAGGRVILDNSRITASASEDASQASGSIDITAARGVFLSNRSVIGSRTQGTGQAGTIFIDAGPVFEARDSSVTTDASTQSEAGGGVIDIRATERVVLTDSHLTTSVENGGGNGGDINIDPQLMLVNRSSITAKAESGNGGSIHIVAGTFIVSSGSEISADSDTGIDGVVAIESPDAELNTERAEPAQEFLDAAGLLRTSCGAANAQAGSFVVARVAGLPASPEGPLPAPLWRALAESGDTAGAAPSTRTSDAASLRVAARADGCRARKEL